MEQSPLCYVALECLESHHCNELRSSCKPACQRTAFFLKTSLSTNCVLLESQLANGLRPSKAQASCKECAALRQAARSALRSAVMQGRTFTAQADRVKKSVASGV